MVTAGRGMLGLGAPSVLIKGGHMKGDLIRDILVTANGVKVFDSERIDSPNTHGTGCTLAAAIATGISQGMDLESSISRGREYVQKAILTAPGIGKGHGPLNHSVDLSS